MSRRRHNAPNSVLVAAGLLAVAALLAVPSALEARSGGIDGYSSNPATNGGQICTACHSGGIAPTVTLSGPTTVAPNTVHTYTLTISGGQEIAGGLDVSVTDGTLAVSDAGTYLRNGEITHSSPRNADGNGNVSFTFNWVVPSTEGSAVLYAAGNSVNRDNRNNGDLPSQDRLVVTIGSSGPGETSAAGSNPLQVTGYDSATGELTLSYESGCSTTENNIYFGALDSVATYGWSGEQCAIGTSGSFSQFNPGSGSYFFVIVGNDGSDEGSYGLAWPAGQPTERPPFVSNACGASQTLTNRCD